MTSLVNAAAHGTADLDASPTSLGGRANSTVLVNRRASHRVHCYRAGPACMLVRQSARRQLMSNSLPSGSFIPTA